MNEVKQDTTKSDKVVRAYQERTCTLERFKGGFSGTWEATIDKFFSLLCPARESDWIPGWKVEILHSDAGGYVSERCVFRTKKSSSDGGGVWIFTGYRKNSFIEVVRFQEELILNVRVEAEDNGDGTVTGTWNVVASALSEKGNKNVEKMRKRVSMEAKLLPKVVKHYLETGKIIKKVSLAFDMVHG